MLVHEVYYRFKVVLHEGQCTADHKPEPAIELWCE